MKILTKMLKQKAVYWEMTSDGRSGRQASAPVEVSCRWEDKNEKFLTPQGVEEVSRAVVYVGSDLKVGGFLKLGTLVSLGSITDPNVLTGVHEIKQFGKLPTLKETEFLRTCYL